MSRRDVEKKLKLRAVLTGLRKTYGNVAVPPIRAGAGLEMLIEANAVAEHQHDQRAAGV
jgi:hypothetical protein